MKTTAQIETPAQAVPTKAALISALRAFIAQRSGIEWGNYSCGDYKSSRAAFMGDYRPIIKHGKHARKMLRSVELRDSITAEDIMEASRRAFSGRLTFRQAVRHNPKAGLNCENGAAITPGPWGVDYCPGQYFPTEYRNAACAVLASVLWNYWRECLPVPAFKQHGKAGEPMSTEARYNGLSAGDWIRRQARNEFGRGIAATWFN